MIPGIPDRMGTLGGTSVLSDLDGTLVDSEPNYYRCRPGRLLGPADEAVPEDAVPGAAAAHAAGMRCTAIPYVAAQADAPEFTAAGLLVRGGQAEFTARAAYEWLARTVAQGADGGAGHGRWRRARTSVWARTRPRAPDEAGEGFTRGGDRSAARVRIPRCPS